MRLCIALAVLLGWAFSTQAAPRTGPVEWSQLPSVFATYDPKNYGAICDGVTHSISATLGITTKAALAAYTLPNGTTPYAWINNAEWTPKVALPMTGPASLVSTNTTLRFDSLLGVPSGGAATITGTGIPAATTATTVTQAASTTRTTNGATTGVGTTSITVNSAGVIPVGSHITGSAFISPLDYVVSSSATNITLKWGLTATPLPTATVLTVMQPASILLSAGLNATKPTITSAASTAGANYWVYATWPLTDAMVAAAEMDWLGIQSAIEAGTSTLNDGAVGLPAAGKACIMNNATVAGNGLGWLMLHENTGAYTPTSGMDMIGAAMFASNLTWPTDMGAGRVAVSNGVPYATWDNLAGRYAAANVYFGRLQAFTMIGPNGYAGGTVETTPVQMDGMYAGLYKTMRDVTIHGFRIGSTYETLGHTHWDNIDLGYNVYGLRVGAVSPTAYGNNIINHLEISNALRAAIDIDKDGVIGNTDINTVNLSLTPVSVRYEEGPTSSYGQPGGSTIFESNWNSVLAESIAMFIQDMNHGTNGGATGTPQCSAYQWNITHLDILYDAAFKPVGMRNNYWFDCSVLTNSNIQFGTFAAPVFVTGLQAGIFIDYANSQKYGGTTFEGPFTTILAGYGATPFITGGVLPFSEQYAVRIKEKNVWSGHLEMYGSATGAVQGTPLEYIAGCSSADRCVQKSGGTAPFGGINMSAATANNQFTVVASRFCASQVDNISIPTSGTATAGSWAKLAAGGTITNATGPSTAGEVVIGVIFQQAASLARVNVGPNGMCD